MWPAPATSSAKIGCVKDCSETERLIGEHSTPNAFKHGKPDQLMCVACHKVKTLRDVKAIAKTKRLNGAPARTAEEVWVDAAWAWL
jgi:hypothetical protein